jgi:hypothetical protein
MIQTSQKSDLDTKLGPSWYECFKKKSKTSISWYEMLKRNLQYQYQAGMKFQKKIQVVGWKGDTLPTLSMIYDIFCSLFHFNE